MLDSSWLRCATLAGLGLLAAGAGPLYSDMGSVSQADDTFVNVLGGTYRLPTDARAVVLIFYGPDCPISNAFAPEIIRLDREFSPKGVCFCIVFAEADLKAEDARKHAQEFGFTCPCLLDPKMRLARKTGATVKPEAAVLSPQGELLYRGRINDLYIDFGKKRPQPTTHDLKAALNAILAGKPVPVARTKAIGCYIDFPDNH